jgi:hypothetical protein
VSINSITDLRDPVYIAFRDPIRTRPSRQAMELVNRPYSRMQSHGASLENEFVMVDKGIVYSYQHLMAERTVVRLDFISKATPDKLLLLRVDVITKGWVTESNVSLIVEMSLLPLPDYLRKL